MGRLVGGHLGGLGNSGEGLQKSSGPLLANKKILLDSSARAQSIGTLVG